MVHKSHVTYSHANVTNFSCSRKLIKVLNIMVDKWLGGGLWQFVEPPLTGESIFTRSYWRPVSFLSQTGNIGDEAIALSA